MSISGFIEKEVTEKNGKEVMMNIFRVRNSQKTCLLVCFALALVFAFNGNAEARRGEQHTVLRGAAGGALSGAVMGKLSGGKAGKGAAWGAGLGAVRGVVERDRIQQEERLRELELKEAYEKGRQQGKRVDYRNESDRRYMDEGSY